MILGSIYWFFPKYGARCNFKGPRRPDDDEEEEGEEFNEEKIAGGHGIVDNELDFV